MGIGKLVREWTDLIRFKNLTAQERSIVFYAEDEDTWKHFQPIISELVGNFRQTVCYITSSETDPILQCTNESIKTFYIGFGSARTTLFLSLKADVMALTMPDLGNFNIKRSKYPVHYVYIFHSMVSSHMIYRHRAFDQFDSILCVGPHHVEEIRATESLYGLNRKQLVQSGYGLLDSLMSESASRDEPDVLPQTSIKRVLVAPSWGADALLESCGRELIDLLLEANYHVTIRPHVMTMRQNWRLLSDLASMFDNSPNFFLDLNLASQGTVSDYDLMISDWSGASLEYAFGMSRPVLFIDVPRKINNPGYDTLGCVPIEMSLRTEIGLIASPDQLHEVPRLVELLCSDAAMWKERIRESRDRWVYNLGSSGSVGAKYIANLISSETQADQGK